MFIDKKVKLKSKGNLKIHFQNIKTKINKIIERLLENLNERFNNLGFLKNFDCLNIERIKLISDHGNSV